MYKYIYICIFIFVLCDCVFLEMHKESNHEASENNICIRVTVRLMEAFCHLREPSAKLYRDVP